MPNTYTPPIISIAYDMEEGCWQLFATSHGRTTIAGERIFRAEPWPDVRFRHPSEQEAERDAQTLRDYLDECASGKRKDVESVAHGWWED